MIVACYHPLPLSACMLNFDLVSILFGTSIPTSFNILVKMFFTCKSSVVLIVGYTFIQLNQVLL